MRAHTVYSAPPGPRAGLLGVPALGELARRRIHSGADSYPEDRDEEQQAEQEPPEHAPGRSGADLVMMGPDLIAAIVVPHVVGI